MQNVKKIALITGSATRIGKTIAHSLAANDWHVVIHYHTSQKEAEALVKELADKFPIYPLAIKADLSDEEQIKSIFPFINKHIGTVSLLINNASSFRNDNIENCTYDSWQQNMAVNIRAPLVLVQDFKNQLQQNHGNIINILDYCVLKMPIGKFLSYSLSKHSLWELTKLLAVEFAPNIRVNALGLGTIMQSNKQSRNNFDQSILTALLESAGSIDDLCNAIQFILSTPSLTGQIINIDGGKHLHYEKNY